MTGSDSREDGDVTDEEGIGGGVAAAAAATATATTAVWREGRHEDVILGLEAAARKFRFQSVPATHAVRVLLDRRDRLVAIAEPGTGSRVGNS